MITRTVKYEDFNGTEREEKLYFNLTKTELQKFNLTTKGGLQDAFREIIDSRDNEKIYELFEKIIHMSYGIKSDDGKHFWKNPQILDEFKQSAAYDEFIWSLFDSQVAADFVAELIKGATKGIPDVDPDKIVAQAKEEAEKVIPMNS